MLPLIRSLTFVKKYYKNTYGVYQLRYTSTMMTQWKPTIGLEIHAQIATESKLFSGASTNFSSPINSCVSLFDSAVPGTMPVLNKKCVEAGVLTALALSCDVNAVSLFERKHYFYSDLPAGYQITQQKKPLASNGEINFMVFTPGVHKEPYLKSSKIKQIQLEQDSGRSLHSEHHGRSLIDLNRAGVPLMELVFEPDLADGEEAAALVKELSIILQTLGTCSCKMEEGALRVDANVSVSRPDEPLGTRTELKNIGSIRAVWNAVEQEIKRQISILEAGGKIVNETRAWDPDRKETILMREKEDNHDYRFMPETNLPPLRLHVNKDAENKYNLINVSSIKEKLPELPEQIRQTLTESGLEPRRIYNLMSNLELLELYRYILNNGENRTPSLIGHFLLHEIVGFLQHNNLEFQFCVTNREYLDELFDLLQRKMINYHTLKKILKNKLVEPNKMPKQIVEENNWFMIWDERELEKLCLDVLEKNPKLVKKYKAGKMKVFKNILHEVMKVTECADMAQVTKIMTRLLK